MAYCAYSVTISGHEAPVTSVCVVPSASENSGDDSDLTLASASHDASSRLTSYNVETKTSKALASLHLYTVPLSSIAVSSRGTHLLTTGWDNLVGLWEMQIPSSDEVFVPSVDEARRMTTRLDRDEKHHEMRAYSVSLDATVRSWDIEAGVCLHTQTVPEALFIALAHLAIPQLLAAASTGRNVRIFDTRVFSSQSSISATASVVLQHASTPVALAPSLTTVHHVASGEYDGVVRVWDVRSTKGAVASFRADKGTDLATRNDGKVLGLDWKSGMMAVGGEAGLDVWSVPEKAKEAR